MSQYRISMSEDADRDMDRISDYLENYESAKEKVITQINKDILDLTIMPRIHKTLCSAKDPNGEYRRIVSGNYIIIYKIEKNQVIILRIFSHKQNYLNSKNFILKENPSFYNVTK